MPSKAAILQTSHYDWSKKFKNKTVRESIIAMVNATVNDDSNCLLDPDSSDEVFANTLLTYIPKAYKYLPEGVVGDESKRKAVNLLAQLAKKEDINEHDMNLACAFLILISRGVKSLDFGYSGGWDETSYNDDIVVGWQKGALPPVLDKKFKKDYGELRDFITEMFNEVKEETEITDGDILYRFLDDSGAGDGNTYFQWLLLDFSNFKFTMHDYEEDEWEDEEGESEEK